MGDTPQAPGPMTLEETMGSVTPLQSDKSIEEMIREAKEERVKRFIAKMNQQERNSSKED